MILPVYKEGHDSVMATLKQTIDYRLENVNVKMHWKYINDKLIKPTFISYS